LNDHILRRPGEQCVILGVKSAGREGLLGSRDPEAADCRNGVERGDGERER
jgi:hypothetical protein